MRRRAKIIPFPGVPLAPQPEEPAEPAVDARAFVEVRRCDQPEALVVKGLLESDGIPTLLRSRLSHSVHPFSVGGQGEVVILVPQAHAVRARRLLTGAVPRRRSS
jgi:hypothetical protein